MWWIFLLGLCLLWEAMRYHNHRRLVAKLHKKKRNILPLRKQWEVDHCHRILQPSLHLQLAGNVEGYEIGTRSVLTPHYKPLLYYGLLRGAHETSYHLAKWYGWSCCEHQGVWFWERGSGSTLLFLHGFGFGPYAYGPSLHKLSRTHRVIAPQYPGLSYDGRSEVPLIQDYARIINSYLADERYSILSNSFGTIVHHALLRELGPSVTKQVIRQVYVEPVCFYPYAGQLFSFVELSWGSCLRAPTWKASVVALLSHLLVAKDVNTLYLCQQILEDPRWDGELHLPYIPTVIVLSEHDTLIRVPELHDYLQHHYPTCRVVVVPNAYHGGALFSKRLKINTLLFDPL